MKIINLSSGSKGNSTLIMSEHTNILVDMGISLKELSNRLKSIKIEPIQINAVFITHEHSDHIKGIPTLIKKYPQIKVFVHKPLYDTIISKFTQTDTNKIISYDSEINLGDFHIESFELSHDSVDCVGYQIGEGANKVAIATDFGFFNENIIKYLSECKLVVLEANHDVEKLLKNPHYPIKTKARILSGKGHLSNNQASELIYRLSKSSVKQIILAHLSDENNSPIIAYNTICEYLYQHNVIEGKDIYIDIAYQDRVGNLFVVD